MSDHHHQTTRRPGEVIDFPGTGRVIIQFVEDGQIFFSSWEDGKEDPWLARMTFEDFEASLQQTKERLERNTHVN